MITPEVLEAFNNGMVVEFNNVLGRWIRMKTQASTIVCSEGPEDPFEELQWDFDVLIMALATGKWREPREYRDFLGAMQWVKEGHRVYRTGAEGFYIKPDSGNGYGYAAFGKVKLEDFQATDWYKGGSGE